MLDSSHVRFALEIYNRATAIIALTYIPTDWTG